MFVRKFAVTHTIGNEEKVLKTFPENEKGEALAYGAEEAKKIKDGVVACILARYDENDHRQENECQVFEVWPFEG